MSEIQISINNLSKVYDNGFKALFSKFSDLFWRDLTFERDIVSHVVSLVYIKAFI